MTGGPGKAGKDSSFSDESRLKKPHTAVRKTRLLGFHVSHVFTSQPSPYLFCSRCVLETWGNQPWPKSWRKKKVWNEKKHFGKNVSFMECYNPQQQQILYIKPCLWLISYHQDRLSARVLSQWSLDVLLFFFFFYRVAQRLCVNFGFVWIYYGQTAVYGQLIIFKLNDLLLFKMFSILIFKIF